MNEGNPTVMPYLTIDNLMVMLDLLKKYPVLTVFDNDLEM